MRIKTLAIACAIVAVATCAVAQTVAPEVVVAASPATTKAVVEAQWWSGLADQAVTALSGLLIAAVGVIGPVIFNNYRGKNMLLDIAIKMGLLDKFTSGVSNIIRSEAEKMRGALKGHPELSADQKKELVGNIQPKVEAEFKETLQKLGKKPGSDAVTDMILGRVDPALADKPAPVIPAVMARS